MGHEFLRMSIPEESKCAMFIYVQETLGEVVVKEGLVLQELSERSARSWVPWLPWEDSGGQHVPDSPDLEDLFLFVCFCFHLTEHFKDVLFLDNTWENADQDVLQPYKLYHYFVFWLAI